MARSDVAIIIPAFNEEKSIFFVIKKSLKYGDVIVINDGSNDNTKIISESAGAIVLNNKKPGGYDNALNKGFEFVANKNYHFAVTIDADGQHDPLCIPKLLNKIRLGFDLVIGKRQKKARISEHIFSFYTQNFWNISDPLSGLKAYKLEIYHELGYFDSYYSIGTEMLLFSLKSGFKVCEETIEVKPREGKSRFGNLIKANYKILKSFILSFSKKYN